jgi:glycopeptide antibiotics resistance protein
MSAPRRKQLSRFLFIVSALFIVYGTTIPFSFTLNPSEWANRWIRINWYPLRPGYSNSLFDDLQNILLFLPFGFMGWTAVRDKSRRMKAFWLVGASCLLSAFVESVQILSNTRTPALTDIFFNTFGGAIGVVAAMITRKWVHAFGQHPEVRGFAASEAAYPALVFAVLVLIGQWAPFDFSLDFGQFKHKVRQLLTDPWAWSLPGDDLIFMGRQMLLAVFLGRLLRQRDKGHPLGRAFLAGTLASAFGVALELSQVFVSSRGPNFQDMGGIVLGSFLGALLVPIQGWRRYPLPSAAFTYLVVVASVALAEMHPFRFGPWHNGFNFIPFMSEYSKTSFHALALFIESALAWVPLGFCWAYLLPRQKAIPFLGVGTALATAFPFELAQGFVEGRFPDVTDILGAGMGVTAGYLLLSRGREAFQGYLSDEPLRQDGRI